MDRHEASTPSGSPEHTPPAREFGDGRIPLADRLDEERARHIRAEEAFDRSGERLRFAMELAELGVWELDLDSQRTWCTLRHDQIFGYDSLLPEWTYATFLDHVHPDDRDDVDLCCRGGMEARTAWRFECRIRRADGLQRWIAVRAGVIRDEHRQPARLLSITQDVTDRKLADEALERAKEEAERANRAKSDFLAVMSHELRTPLNAIAGYAELMELGLHGPVTEKQRDALIRIQRSQRHLLGLINGVLNYARIESGSVSYEISSVRFSSTCCRTP